MALNIRSVEKITGCQLDVVYADDIHFVEASKDGVPVALGQGRVLKDALQEVVDAVYKMNSRQAMEDGEWRCHRCGKLTPLQAHHEIHRSRGRRQDNPEGLLPTCAACHEKIHGAKAK